MNRPQPCPCPPSWQTSWPTLTAPATARRRHDNRWRHHLDDRTECATAIGGGVDDHRRTVPVECARCGRVQLLDLIAAADVDRDDWTCTTCTTRSDLRNPNR